MSQSVIDKAYEARVNLYRESVRGCKHFMLNDYYHDLSLMVRWEGDPYRILDFLLHHHYRMVEPRRHDQHAGEMREWVPGHFVDGTVGPVRKARVMVIGKQVCAEDVTAHSHHNGTHGTILRGLFERVGVTLNPADTYYTSVMKMYFDLEKVKTIDKYVWRSFIPLLLHEISLVSPEIILGLGLDVCKALFGNNAQLQEYRSQPIMLEGNEQVCCWATLGNHKHKHRIFEGFDQENIFQSAQRCIVLMTQSPGAVAREEAMRFNMERDVAIFKTLLDRTYSITKDPYKLYDIRAVRTLAELRKEVDAIVAANPKELSIDCEWAGSDYLDVGGDLRFVQFSHDGKTAIVVIFTTEGGRRVQSEVERIEMIAEIRRLATIPGICINGHNLRADAKWLGYQGVHILAGNFFDTMLADHMLNENTEHGLEACAVRYTDMGRYDFDVAKWVSENKANVDKYAYRDVPERLLIPYSALDVIATERIKLRLVEELNREENKALKACYYNIVLPCNLPLHEIETTGLLVDKARMYNLVKAYDEVKNKLLASLRIAVGNNSFNPRSHVQIKQLLFNRTEDYIADLKIRVEQIGDVEKARDVIPDHVVDEYLEIFVYGTEQTAEELAKKRYEVARERRKVAEQYDLKTRTPSEYVRKRDVYKPGMGLTPYKTTGKPSRMWAELTPHELGNATPSSDAESLEWLAASNPQNQALRLLRDFKLIDQVAKSFLRMPEEDAVRPDDYTTGLAGSIDTNGRIRTSLSQMSETGRQKSYDPNMQNLPKKQEKELDRILQEQLTEATEYGFHTQELVPDPNDKTKQIAKVTVKPPSIRSCFIAPEKSVIIEVDYKSAEVFTMGFLSNEPQLVKDAKTDLHARGAVNYFNCPKWDGFDAGIAPPKDWLDKFKAERVAAKTINFGIPYQRGAKAVAREIEKQTKGKVSCDADKAQRFIDGFYRTYPGMRAYVDMCSDSVERPPYYLSNPYGRRRRFYVASHRDRGQIAALKREAVNFPIQSTVADTLNVALANFYAYLRMWPGEASYKILLAVHDATLLEVPDEYVDIVINKVIPMCMSAGAIVPSWQPTPEWKPTTPFQLDTDVEVYLRWGEHPTLEQLDKHGLKGPWINRLFAKDKH